MSHRHYHKPRRRGGPKRPQPDSPADLLLGRPEPLSSADRDEPSRPRSGDTSHVRLFSGGTAPPVMWG